MNLVRLTRPRKLGLYAVAAGLWGSGAVWLIAHYYLVRQGDYGPQTSPLEPWMLDLHGAFAMLALWFMGLLWGVHVVKGWAARRGRLSGGVLLGLLVSLVASGYCLYYVGDDTWRGWASRAHWIVGLALLPLFLWHRFARKRRSPMRG